MATDTQIDEMLAREAIRDLPILYCHYVRTGNLKAMMDLFSDEPEAVMPQEVGMGRMPFGGSFKGRAKLEELLTAAFKNTKPFPFVHNHVIDVQLPDKGTGWVYSEIRDEHDNLRTAQIVIYEDDYIKENGKWKFKRRKLNSQPIPK